MQLPRFWKDCGHWNESLMSCSIVTTVILGIISIFRYQLSASISTLLLIGSLPVGFLVGVSAVAVMCRFFRRD